MGSHRDADISLETADLVNLHYYYYYYYALKGEQNNNINDNNNSHKNTHYIYGTAREDIGISWSRIRGN